MKETPKVEVNIDETIEDSEAAELAVDDSNSEESVSEQAIEQEDSSPEKKTD